MSYLELCDTWTECRCLTRSSVWILFVTAFHGLILSECGQVGSGTQAYIHVEINFTMV